MSTAVAGYKRSFGSDGPPGAYEDLETADVILLIGANIADNHPILCRRLQANPGTHAHRRRSARDQDGDDGRPAPAAAAALRPGADQRPDPRRHRARPGRSRLHRRLHHRLRRAARVGARATRPSAWPEITGLAPEQIYRTAWLYANAKAAFIGWTMGVNHSTKGTETVNAINNLALITGNIGRAGRRAVLDHRPVQRHGHARERLRLEPARLPQVRERSRPQRAGGAVGHRAPSAFPRRAAWRIPTSSRRRSTSGSAALWIIATNPIVSFPNLGALQQALEGLEFLVVQDGFPPTPTGEFADLVLPAAIWGEKEGTYTNSERRVSKVEPRGGAAGRGARRLRHLPGARRQARRARRAVPGLAHAGRRVRGVEARVGGPAVRLLRHDLRRSGDARRRAVAVSRRRHRAAGHAAPLRLRRLQDRRRPRAG